MRPNLADDGHARIVKVAAAVATTPPMCLSKSVDRDDNDAAPGPSRSDAVALVRLPAPG